MVPVPPIARLPEMFRMPGVPTPPGRRVPLFVMVLAPPPTLIMPLPVNTPVVVLVNPPVFWNTVVLAVLMVPLCVNVPLTTSVPALTFTTPPDWLTNVGSMVLVAGEPTLLLIVPKLLIVPELASGVALEPLKMLMVPLALLLRMAPPNRLTYPLPAPMSNTPALFQVFAFRLKPLLPAVVVLPLVLSVPAPVMVLNRLAVRVCPLGMVMLSALLRVTVLLTPTVKPALKTCALPVLRLSAPPVTATGLAKLVTLLADRLTVAFVTLHVLLLRMEKSLVAAVLMVLPPANTTVAPLPVTAALPLKIWVPPPNCRVLPLAALMVLLAL